MTYTKEQIIERAKSVLREIGFNYDTSEKVTIVEDNTPHIKQDPLQKLWLVSFPWGKEDFDSSRLAFLHMDADTGLPVKFQFLISELVTFYKNEDGEIESSDGKKFILE